MANDLQDTFKTSPLYFSDQNSAPVAPQLKPEFQDKPQEAASVTGKIFSGITKSFLPSLDEKAMNEKNPLKAGAYFTGALAQDAWNVIKYIPEGAYNFTKSVVQDIKQPGSSEQSHQIQQGLKESGLAGGFLTGLSQALPFLVMAGGALEVPKGATPSEFGASTLLGQNIKTPKLPEQEAKTSTPVFQPVKDIELQMEQAKQAMIQLRTKLTAPAKELKPGEIIPETERVIQMKTLSRYQQLYNKLENERDAMTKNILDSMYDLPRPGQESVINTLDDQLKQSILENNTPAKRPSVARVLSAPETRLHEAGPAGRLLEDKVRAYLEEPQMKSGPMIYDLKEVTDGMTREELFNMKGVLQGRAKPINATVEKAAKLARAQDDVLKNLGQKYDPNFSPIENHLTQKLPTLDQLKNKQFRTDVIDNMVYQDKTVGSVKEANALLDDWVKYLKKGEVGQSIIDYVQKTKGVNLDNNLINKVASPELLNEIRGKLNAYTRPSASFGPFEKRALDLPFYDPNPARVLPDYYTRAFQYIHKLQNWGPAGKYLYDLVNIIGKEGGDAKYAQNFVDFLTKGNQADMAIKTLQDKLLRYNVATKMELSFLPHMTQGFLGSAIYGGIKNALKGLFNMRSDMAKEFAIKSAGVPMKQMDNVMSNAFGTNIETGMAAKVLKPTRLAILNNFYENMVDGGMFMNDLADRLAKNANDAYAVRKLQDLHFKDSEIADIAKNGLDKDTLAIGAQRYWKRAQSIPDILNTPEFMHSGWGRILTQFKSVAYRETSMVWNGVVKEARHGNFEPLLVTMVVAPAVGEIIGDIKDILRLKNPFGARGSSLITHPDFVHYIGNLRNAFALGLAYDLFSSMNGVGKFAESIGGPTVGTIGEGLSDIGSMLKGKVTPTIKSLLNQIPWVGKSIKNLVLPAKAAEITNLQKQQINLTKVIDQYPKNESSQTIKLPKVEKTIFASDKMSNNNVGNILYNKSSTTWLKDFGATKNPKSAFAQFPTAEQGIMAAKRLIVSPVYKNKTIEQAVHTWSHGDYNVKELQNKYGLKLDGKTKVQDLSIADLHSLIEVISHREGFGQWNKVKSYLDTV